MAHIELTFGECDTGLKRCGAKYGRPAQALATGLYHPDSHHGKSAVAKGSASPSVQVAFVSRHHPSGEEFDTGTSKHGSFERLQCLSIALRTAPIPLRIGTAKRCIALALRAFRSPSLAKAIVWRRTRSHHPPLRRAILRSALRTDPAVGRRLPGIFETGGGRQQFAGPVALPDARRQNDTGRCARTPEEGPSAGGIGPRLSGASRGRPSTSATCPTPVSERSWPPRPNKSEGDRQPDNGKHLSSRSHSGYDFALISSPAEDLR